MAAAETVGVGGLAELAACADGDPVLLVAPERAAALAGSSTRAHGREMMVVPAATSAELSAYRLPPSLLNPQALRGLADPTVAPASTLPLQRVLEPPPLGAAALALAKLARLLPTLVVAPAGETVESSGLLAAQAADVLAYPVTAAATLHPAAEAAVPLDGAPDARLVAFRAADGGVEHLAVLVGRPDELARSAGGRAPLVRLHSECFTGDVLGSLRCDCGPQLRGAILRMAEEGAGVLLYLAQEGRGIGLVNKLRAYRLQDGGLDTLDANRALGWHADERSFMVAAAMLERLGVTEDQAAHQQSGQAGGARGLRHPRRKPRSAPLRAERRERRLSRRQGAPLRPPADLAASVQAVVTPDGLFRCGRDVFRCAVERGGVRADKREGDGATPAGSLPLRRVLYRADRVAVPPSRLADRAALADRRVVRRSDPRRLQPCACSCRIRPGTRFYGARTTSTT